MFSDIWERIKNEIKISQLKDLANELGIVQSSISRKRKENKFPVEWAYTIGRKYNLLTEWIMTGEGPKSLNKIDSNNKKRSKEKENGNNVAEKITEYSTCDNENSEKNRVLNNIDKWLSEITENDPRRITWFECTLEDKIPEYKEWVRKKEEIFDRRIREPVD